MLIAIAGGALQGTEAAYLTHRAGGDLLIDQKAHAPASGLCDRFLRADVRDEESIRPHLKSVDLILPALEDSGALCPDPFVGKDGYSTGF